MENAFLPKAERLRGCQKARKQRVDGILMVQPFQNQRVVEKRHQPFVGN